MRLFSIFLLLFLSLNIFAQKNDDVLATANGQNYTSLDLTPEARAELENLPKTIAATRQSLLEQQINAMLFETEAAAQQTTVEKLLEKEVKAKIPAPTDAQIKAVYDVNAAAVGGRTLAEVRPQIVAYLRRESEQNAFAAFLSNLRTKHKASLGKDVNAANLNGFEVLATVSDKQITTRSYEAANKVTLAETEADIYDDVRESLDQIVYSNLVIAEAKAQNISAGDLITREITDKSKTPAPDESARLEAALRQKLYQKYNAKFNLKEIAPVVQNISVDDDPAQGKADAPVTIVMFTDFQCPACSATHPVVKSVLAEFGDKVRLVVRDFPLVQIHENAFRAAVAAGAAHAQGKFFEYTEVLYKNQTNLDAASLRKYAGDLNLNLKQFDLDLASQQIADEVRQDAADGKRYGLSGTPTLFVNGVKVRRFSPENFRASINKALKK
ncbi:MAG: thioredoxin domain-containing protein [Pyrinomonadaceae bacterium]|nr:thioredoxin domain-containing protein [Pyrinomonadaceae bacterium]